MYEKLVDAGLDTTQAQIYVALLTRGTLTQTQIANATDLNRSSLYKHIATLLNLNIISQSRIGKRTYYQAEHPKNLNRHFKQKLTAYERVAPQLDSVYEKNKKVPVTNIHYGVKGMRVVHQEIAETAHSIKTFFTPAHFLDVLRVQDGLYFTRATSKRDVPVKGLCSDSRDNRKYLKWHHEKNEQTKLMPKGITYPIEVVIYNQNVAIFSFTHSFVTVIENKEIKDFHEQLFDYFWSIAKG